MRLERHLAHPIEKVWAAPTEPRRLSEWLAEGEIELRLGGRVHLKGDEIESTGERARSAEADPVRVEDGRVGWRTDPLGARSNTDRHPLGAHARIHSADRRGANELRETHDLPPGWDPLPSTLAGWHTILANLSSALDGAPRGSTLQAGKAMEGWQEQNEHYKKVLVR